MSTNRKPWNLLSPGRNAGGWRDRNESHGLRPELGLGLGLGLGLVQLGQLHLAHVPDISFLSRSLSSLASSSVEGCVSEGLHCGPGVLLSEGGSLGFLSILLSLSPTLMPKHACHNKPLLKLPRSSL